MKLKVNKDMIKEDGFITRCSSNISKMNVFQYIWFYSEITLRKRPNILWSLLFLFCPWYDDLWWIITREGILSLTVLEFLSFILVLFFTVFGLGPIFSITYSYLRIKDAKKFCNRRTS